MHKRNSPAPKVCAEINVTPMADIMLVLLIIFMLTAPLLESGVTVNLPKARNPLDAHAEDELTVSLTREGRIYLARTVVSEDELRRILTERFAGEINKTVFLRADSAVSYGRVVQVVHECRQSGAERIALMTEKDQQ